MTTEGPAWPVACAALLAAWTAATSWRAGSGALRAAVRGVLGGLAALGAASAGYGLLRAAGIDVAWEGVAGGGWGALGTAALIGLVEEGGKLAGIALAADLMDRRSVFRSTAAVAAVFAIGEAAVALRGAPWGVALGRAAFGPVAHGLLAAPLALALADAPARSRPSAAVRAGAALALAAALHAAGDWSIARPGWGPLGFAAALLAPTLALFFAARRSAATGFPALRRA